jgi:hypothetical protein
MMRGWLLTMNLRNGMVVWVVVVVEMEDERRG